MFLAPPGPVSSGEPPSESSGPDLPPPLPACRGKASFAGLHAADSNTPQATRGISAKDIKDVIAFTFSKSRRESGALEKWFGRSSDVLRISFRRRRKNRDPSLSRFSAQPPQQTVRNKEHGKKKQNVGSEFARTGSDCAHARAQAWLRTNVSFADSLFSPHPGNRASALLGNRAPSPGTTSVGAALRQSMHERLQCWGRKR